MFLLCADLLASLKFPCYIYIKPNFEHQSTPCIMQTTVSHIYTKHNCLANHSSIRTFTTPYGQIQLFIRQFCAFTRIYRVQKRDARLNSNVRFTVCLSKTIHNRAEFFHLHYCSLVLRPRIMLLCNAKIICAK